MHERRKRWLAALLSAALVVGLVPTSALAEIADELSAAEAGASDAPGLEAPDGDQESSALPDDACKDVPAATAKGGDATVTAAQSNAPSDTAQEGESAAAAQDITALRGQGTRSSKAATASPAKLDTQAQGTWGTCDWDIDSSGKLTVHPGVGEDTGGNTPWAEHYAIIKSVVFQEEDGNKVIAPQDCSMLCAAFTLATSIDMSGLETSQVRNMQGMFWCCFYVTSLDLTSWNTANVEDMSALFYRCEALETLDVHNWSTRKAKTMWALFASCGALESIDISDWNTASVENMAGMFADCSSLESLNVSSLNTSGATTMEEMFEGCSSLTSLDAANWDTHNVMDMTGMFWGCKKLEELQAGNWNTQNLTMTKEMFYGCESLASLDVSGWDMADVMNTKGMFNGCAALTSIEITGWDTGSVADMSEMFRSCSKLESLDLSSWDTDIVTDMSYMFCDCTLLESLSLTSWNTAKVENMTSMFQSCSSLAAVFAGSPWATDGVKESGNMFLGCTKIKGGTGTAYDENCVSAEYARLDGGASAPGYLRSADLSGFMVLIDSGIEHGTVTADRDHVSATDTNRAVTLTVAPDDGYELASLSVARGETAVNVAQGTGDNADKWTFQMPNADVSVTAAFEATTPSSEPEPIARGTWGKCPWEIDAAGALTVHHGTGEDTGGISPWEAHKDKITSVVFAQEGEGEDVSKVIAPADCSFLLRDLANVTSVDASGLDTSSVTNMRGMFVGCSSLETLDTSGWNTERVMNMRSMFYCCSSLETLDLSSWDTCKQGGVSENMGDMFHACVKLKTIYVGNGWDADVIGESDNMFTDCTSLVGGAGTAYDESHVEKDYAHVDGGEDDPGYLTFKAAGTWGTCPWEIVGSTLTVHHGTGEDTGGISPWEAHKDKITSVVFAQEGEGEDVSKVIAPVDCSFLLEDLANVTSIDASGLDTSSVTYMVSMFDGCTSLADLDLSGWDTAGVTNMGAMFSGCSSLEELDLSSFDTGSVEDMSDMFYGCEALETIYVGGSWSTANVDNSDDMFYGCANLVGGAGTVYDESQIDAAYARIDGGPDAPGYLTAEIQRGTWGTCPWEIDAGKLTVHPGTGADTGGTSPWAAYKDDVTSVVFESVETDGNTSKVEAPSDCSMLFFQFGNLTEVDTSGLDASHVTNMGHVFRSCSKLESIDVSKWDTASVTRMDGLFSDCSSLASLDVSKWDTAKVTSMVGLFSGCSGLTTLDVSGWDTARVKQMDGLFSDCSNLTSLDLSRWDTACVGSLAEMFLGCRKLALLDVSKWDTKSVSSMYRAFDGCGSLVSLDLSGWDTRRVTNMDQMFDSCSSLVTVYAGDGWSTQSVTTSTYMFWGCKKLVGGEGTTYDRGHIDAEYARVDGGTQKPGYFTAVVRVTGVELSSPSLELAVGDTAQLEATVAPGDATFKNVTWSSSDESVATVDETGVVTAVAAGNATITVTTKDGGLTAACEVTVAAPAANEIVTDPVDATAAVGDFFTLTVEATGDVASYRWENSKNGGATWSDVKWAGHDAATLSYRMAESLDGRMFRCVVTFSDGTSAASQPATVSLPDPADSRLATQPADATAAAGERFTLAVAAEDPSEVVSYGWQHSRDGSSWSDVAWAGRDTDTLSYRMAESLDGRMFRCVVTFADGTHEASEAATLTLAAPSSGRITSQPDDATAEAGERFELSVEADGATSWRWQHSRDGSKWSDVAWSGHDTATLSYRMSSSLDGRMFRCVVTFADGTAEVSDVATVRLPAEAA